MDYLEHMPEGCPPAEADEVTAERDVFRLVRTSPPTLNDFRSLRAEKPDAVLPPAKECQACGLSVFADRADSEKAKKLTALRGRFVCRLQLEAGAGRIQQTGKPSHHTWWPLTEFDILAHCAMEAV